MRNKFDEQMQLLHTELLEMCALIAHGIVNATQALIDQDAEQARCAIAIENEVDRKEREIETLCLRLLLQQQPVARDLRIISSALKMITDMERIGDQVADISEIVLTLTGSQYIKKLVHLPQMAEATKKMLNGSIDAFIKSDEKLANEVIKMDDIIDDLFKTIKDELIAIIHEDRSNGVQALDFLMIAKYYERIGDHAVNIAEWVLFSLTGVHNHGKSIEDL